ncbi:MAG: hypothetical protein RJB58_1714, partial [Pseudomonadota bacterium]
GVGLFFGMSKLLIQASFYQFAWYKKSQAGHYLKRKYEII